MRNRRAAVARVACLLAVVAGLAGGPLAAQRSRRSDCTPAGTWYGGSVVAYQMTIFPTTRTGHYAVLAEGMYRDGVMSTTYTGEVVKKGDRYEGPLMQLYTADSTFLKPPPVGKLPDINAGWTILELLDCNTLRNTLPFFGTYAGAGIWQPGIAWTPGGKIPLVDRPDVDLLDVLNGGKPIVESYHRLPTTLNPALVHKAVAAAQR